eukprot:Seg2798.1 transcript_id=Seg2798.1/GoldUCD/mRNA.D3Y31 product="hypothetical protein" protein_id=Seg2798.1/GoldUCD/D3Y31
MGTLVRDGFLIATYIVSATAVIVNIIGICLLKISGVKKTIQIMIIMSLSAADLTLALAWLGEETISNVTNSRSGRVYEVWWSLKGGFYLVWYSMIYLLTMDRFMGCNFPIKHKVYVKKKYVRITIIVCWVVGVLIGVISCPFHAIAVRIVYRTYIWIILDITFLTLLTVTYISIFVYLARRRINGTQNVMADNQRFLKTVTALLVAFLLFETIPSLRNVICKQYDPWRKIRDFLYTMNLVCDPFIYVFLQPEVRKFALSKVCALCRRKESRDDAERVELHVGLKPK